MRSLISPYNCRLWPFNSALKGWINGSTFVSQTFVQKFPCTGSRFAIFGSSMKTIVFTFCLTLICSGAVANPNALIYRGPGACKGCPETVGAALESKGILVKYVGPHEISNSVFENVDLY